MPGPSLPKLPTTSGTRIVPGGKVKAGPKSKTRSDECAQAASALAKGTLTHDLAVVLARCRKMVAGKATATPAVRPGQTTEGSKFVGKKVTGKDKEFADAQEKRIAHAVGGRWLSDNEPSDVQADKAGGGTHHIEVKSILKGKKQAITMHDDALLRKVEHARANPGATFHTVAIDHRAHYEGGPHAEHHSGHALYYRRGAGAYALGTMHRVKDEAELKALIAMPDRALPPKARGTLPGRGEIARLKARAKVAHEGRLRRQRAWRMSLKSEAGANP